MRRRRRACASAGSALPADDSADIWTRGCAWQASGMAVTLLVEGALTSKANAALNFEVEAVSVSLSVSGFTPAVRKRRCSR